MDLSDRIPDGEPLGYSALIEMFHLKTAPHYRYSYISKKWERKEIRYEDQNLTVHIYPPSYRLDRDPFSHLEFAIKQEGFNLQIIQKVLENLKKEDVEAYILLAPTSRYARIIWYLYENLTGIQLPTPDIKRGSYVWILDSEDYYVGEERRSRRHRVVDNLLGEFSFCPVVRRTPALKKFEAKNLELLSQEIAKNYNLETISRAMQYLYTKETLSSWEIERERPDKKRLNHFTVLLRKAGSIAPLNKKTLIDLQREIVDPRFALDGYRDFQNYVGEEPALGQIVLHYIAPKPEDVPRLMEALLRCFERMVAGGCHAVICAAVLAFGLVFIHPFWDGNGRLHRFLIHYALARCHFIPKEFVVPVSATMVRQMKDYDRALESISKPLLELIQDYEWNDAGEMKVLQQSMEYYQFMDLTPVSEYLFGCVEKTMTTDLEQELKFLINYDKIKRGLQEIVDMPDQRLDLFIRCVRQNGGTLSTKKRESYFSMLSEEEIRQMEQVMMQ